MSENAFNLRSKEDLCVMKISGLIEDTITDFDIYIEVGGYIVLYAPCPYRWSKSELGRLHNDGHGDLYYNKSDVSKVSAYLRIGRLPLINNDLPPEDRISNITDVAADLTRILFEHPITELTIIKGKEIAESLVDCVNEDIFCVRALTSLSQHDQYTYYHSARVSAYALAIAFKMSQKDEGLLQDLALGCLLHDVGKIKVGQEIINKSGPLTDKEWATMKKHPEFGSKMINESLLSLVPAEIILHHHERQDGKGYPHGLVDKEIIEEVKIAAFADVYDALTSNRPYQVKRTCFEALNFMKFHLAENLHKNSYKAMVEILAERDSAKS